MLNKLTYYFSHCFVLLYFKMLLLHVSCTWFTLKLFKKILFADVVCSIFSLLNNALLQVTCSSFLSAARVRNERGLDRVQALQCMIELVTVCSRTGIRHVPHLLSAVASILAQGPRLVYLCCLECLVCQLIGVPVIP